MGSIWNEPSVSEGEGQEGGLSPLWAFQSWRPGGRRLMATGKLKDRVLHPQQPGWGSPRLRVVMGRTHSLTYSRAQGFPLQTRQQPQTGWGVGEGWEGGERRLLLLLLSPFSRVRLCATPQTAAHQAPPSLGFSRQEHWSWVAIAFSSAWNWKVKVKSLSRVLFLATFLKHFWYRNPRTPVFWEKE